MMKRFMIATLAASAEALAIGMRSASACASHITMQSKGSWAEDRGIPLSFDEYMAQKNGGGNNYQGAPAEPQYAPPAQDDNQQYAPPPQQYAPPPQQYAPPPAEAPPQYAPAPEEMSFENDISVWDTPAAELTLSYNGRRYRLLQ